MSPAGMEPLGSERKPTLSIDEGSNGRVLLKCHAGCSTDAVIAALGLTRRDLFPVPSHRQSGNGATTTPTFHWQRSVDTFSAGHLEQLSKWRGYTGEFCSWLHKSRLVGIVEGCIAFPVIDNAEVVAAHVRRKDGTWRYVPSTKTRPLVIGELAPGDHVYLFESQWDAFAFMDVSGERGGIVCTRGASNGGLVAGVVPERANVYLWPQNDVPGEMWASDVCAHVKKSSVVKVAKTPDKFKDVNDWAKAGATADDLLAAMVNAEKLESVRPFDGIDGFVEGGPADDEPSETAEPFPLHCLPPLVDAMAKEVCATERVPESLAGCCALGILSASIGAGLAVRSASNRLTRGNIYLLASAGSGSGESETYRHLAKPSQQFEMDRIERWKEQDRPDAIAKRDLLEVDIKECKSNTPKSATMTSTKK